MKLNVHALKYGDIAHYDWEMELLEERADCLIAQGTAGRKLRHHTKGQVFEIPHASLEVYALKDGYTVSFDIAEGRLISIYCNAALPCVRTGSDLSFVDLDLDLLWNEAEGWHVVDEDEFAVNCNRFGYPAEVIDAAERSIRELQARAESKLFPFDGSLDDLLNRIAAKTAEAE
ncbi:DUF402 domain-containing protein [Saccharibacillus sp. CPCC 101409]|uniref:DUF402 domain-containing protein n=1 Tax=Saccharibacillus sp. CPCC 101409 TaxID=3058041 RepID=UPI00267172F5|nr:DUF402 domain-containing protein [Saccharibacillus sp. CPCC 101409]MDO3412631.1 DUF402 domain-containing protein [Saccharibacillus sp. CPCC 101409]